MGTFLSELKKCPFCGAEVTLVYNGLDYCLVHEYKKDIKNCVFIFDKGYELKQKTAIGIIDCIPDKNNFIKIWNKRQHPLIDIIEKLDKK